MIRLICISNLLYHINIRNNDFLKGSHHGGMANVLECDIMVNEFELQSLFYD